jgi:transposase
MIRLNFSKEDIAELKKLSSNHPHPTIRRRATALVLKSEDLPHKQISNILGICDNALRAYFYAYRDGGIDGVTAIRFYKPHSQLTAFKDIIHDYLRDTPPSSLKQASAEIENLIGIKISKSQVGRYLRSLGCKYRKVCGVPAKADVEKQKVFKEEKLDPRLSEAQEGKRSVYFIDAAHFVMGAFLGYLWSLARVFIKTPSGRQRFNVLGALNAVTKELLTITNTTYITSIQVCALLRLISSSTTLPITIVLDNARYQRCNLVTALAQELGIELLFLPAYSPNLNLIERYWKFTKKHCLNSKYYKDFGSFKASISNFLHDACKSHKSELETLLSLNFQLFTQEQLHLAA